jgi:regulator of RNase E activity RraA
MPATVLMVAPRAWFPLYGKAVAPYSGPKLGPAEVNVAVCCGGVIVHPGDVVAASEDGIVVVPQMSLVAVVDAVSKAATRAAEGRGDGDPITEFLDEMDEHVAAIFAAGRGKFLP